MHTSLLTATACMLCPAVVVTVNAGAEVLRPNGAQDPMEALKLKLLSTLSVLAMGMKFSVLTATTS